MDLDGGDWAVEVGPIASMKFRQDALAYLSTSLDGFDQAVGAKVLQEERARVAEGLNEKTAVALAKRLGRKETLACATRGPAPEAGMAGALRYGLPFIGVGLAPILGLAIHPVGWLVGLAVAAGLAWKNTKVRMSVLGSAPIGAISDETLDSVIERYVSLKEQLSAGSQSSLAGVVNQSITMLAASSDPDDVMALSLGSFDSLLADSAVKIMEKSVGLAESALKDGRTDFNAEEKATLASLKDLGGRALSKSRGEAFEGLELDAVELSMNEDMEATDEVAAEFEA
jgi:hypothetical protein